MAEKNTSLAKLAWRSARKYENSPSADFYRKALAKLAKAGLIKELNKKELVVAANETQTAVAIDNFAETVKQHIVEQEAGEEKILAQIKKVKAAMPVSYDEAKLKVFLTQRAKTLGVLMYGLVRARLTAKYPMVDPAIFKLRRHLYVNSESKLIADSTTQVEGVQATRHEVPLFMHAGTDVHAVEVLKFKTSAYKEVKVSAPVPSIPAAVLAEGRRAIGLCYFVAADLYNDEVTGDLVDAPTTPKLEVLWIPTANSLEMKVVNIPPPRKFDPALILNYEGSYYLVSIWDAEDEVPFENILREFSSGTVPFPKKKNAKSL